MESNAYLFPRLDLLFLLNLCGLFLSVLDALLLSLAETRKPFIAGFRIEFQFVDLSGCLAAFCWRCPRCLSWCHGEFRVLTSFRCGSDTVILRKKVCDLDPFGFRERYLLGLEKIWTGCLVGEAESNCCRDQKIDARASVTMMMIARTFVRVSDSVDNTTNLLALPLIATSLNRPCG